MKTVWAELLCFACKGHQEVVDLFPLTTDQVFMSSPLFVLSTVFFLGRCAQACFDSTNMGDEP